jgi:hypothetical protein
MLILYKLLQKKKKSDGYFPIFSMGQVLPRWQKQTKTSQEKETESSISIEHRRRISQQNASKPNPVKHKNDFPLDQVEFT